MARELKPGPLPTMTAAPASPTMEGVESSRGRERVLNVSSMRLNNEAGRARSVSLSIEYTEGVTVEQIALTVAVPFRADHPIGNVERDAINRAIEILTSAIKLDPAG